MFCCWGSLNECFRTFLNIVGKVIPNFNAPCSLQFVHLLSLSSLGVPHMKMSWIFLHLGDLLTTATEKMSLIHPSTVLAFSYHQHSMYDFLCLWGLYLIFFCCSHQFWNKKDTSFKICEKKGTAYWHLWKVNTLINTLYVGYHNTLKQDLLCVHPTLNMHG